MAQELGKSIRLALLVIVTAGLATLACMCSCCPPPDNSIGAEAEAAAQFDETNPLGANAACYVCHITFVKEELSKAHLKARITCVGCHGVSAGHANDEDIGATPPDVTFERGRVDAMCLKCHKRHDISGLKAAAAKPPPVCTDCHDTHRIKKAEITEPG
ncbi:MAG: cytochrome c3 family protein [Planctomycetes bacterium]|nr:cytochrome c3 family protein [Planctomycetota bacterium]